MRLELGQRLGGQLLVHEFVADPGQQINALLLMGERGMVDNVLRAPEHLVWMRERLDEGEFRVARAVFWGDIAVSCSRVLLMPVLPSSRAKVARRAARASLPDDAWD